MSFAWQLLLALTDVTHEVDNADSVQRSWLYQWLVRSSWQRESGYNCCRFYRILLFCWIGCFNSYFAFCDCWIWKTCFCSILKGFVLFSEVILSIGGLHMTSSKTWLWKLDQFAPNFAMAGRTIHRVPVPNLKSFEPLKTELWAKEVGEISIM